MSMRTKKAWHFFTFIGCLEVFDYLILPNYNEQSPRHLAGASLLYSWKYHLKVSKFQDIQCTSYFAFSYSMMCINILCGFSHRQYFWLILFCSFNLQRYNFFLRDSVFVKSSLFFEVYSEKNIFHFIKLISISIINFVK